MSLVACYIRICNIFPNPEKMADVVNLTDVDGHFIEEHSYSKVSSVVLFDLF